MITLLLADDHEIFRQGLFMLLNTQPDFEVVGQAASGAEAVQLAERIKPQVAVIDVMMPGLTGLEATRQICQRLPATRVVVLSMHNDESYVVNALQNGASAYVLKESSTADLVQAVRSAAAGQRFLSPSLAERAIQVYLDSQGAARSQPDKVRLLTRREREVLELSMQSLPAAQIARRLGVSLRTAETHRANLMEKLGVHSQAELLAYLRRDGQHPVK